MLPGIYLHYQQSTMGNHGWEYLDLQIAYEDHTIKYQQLCSTKQRDQRVSCAFRCYPVTIHIRHCRVASRDYLLARGASG